MAIVVHFVNGKQDTVENATKAVFKYIIYAKEAGLTGGFAGSVLECLDDKGKVVAQFRDDQVVGYVII